MFWDELKIPLLASINKGKRTKYFPETSKVVDKKTLFRSKFLFMFYKQFILSLKIKII